MRGKEVAKPFFHDCVKKMRNGTKVYKGFKAWELNLLGEFKFLLMVILIPRKKNGFDPEFAEIFKAYNDWGGCPFKGYDSKINLVSTVKKNKNLFKVLLKKYGIFIFREKMDIEIESTMNDDISTDDEATVFSGEIPSPTSRYFKYDSDIIEEVSEKIIESFILPKLLEEIPVLSVDRITNVSDFNSDSSGYGSALTSPSFENSLLSMNSPVTSEGFCENDDNQVKENSLLIEIENTRNLPSFQNCPSTSSVGQLVQTSREQFSNEQAVMNVLMPELGNTGNSSSFQNLPSTSSVGQLVQTSQEQFFNEQAMMNASMPELGNTGNSSSFQNLPSTSSVGQLVQTSQEQFFNEQAMMNASMPELGNTGNSSSFQNLPSTSSVGQLVQTSQEQFFNEQAMMNASMPELGNTGNSPSFQNFPSTSPVRQLVQTSQGHFFNEQAMMNALMPELGNTSNSSSFQNLSSTSSVGQLIQTSQGQFFNNQTMINVSMPVHENTRKSSLQNVLSTSLVEKFTMNSQEQFSNEQSMINDLISEKLAYYIPASTVDLSSENTIQNTTSPLLEIPSNTLDHSYSIPYSSIGGNSAGDDQSMACNSTPPNNKFDDTQSSFLNQAQLVDFNPNSALNGSLVHHFSKLSEGCLGMSPRTEEINPILEKSEKDYQNTVVDLDPQSNQLGNSEISKAPWIDIDQNADQNILHFSKFSKSHSGMQFSAKEDVNTVLENSIADEQHALSNSSPPFAACGNFHSYFVEVPSVAFSGNSDTSILEQSPANLSEKYLDMPSNINEKDELILGVLKKKDVFQKYFSLTDIPTRKKDQRYPSVSDFFSVGFEILEEMETSDSESDLLGNIAQNMDCSTEFVPDPSRLENGSMYYQMFGIPNTDCLNDDMQE